MTEENSLEDYKEHTNSSVLLLYDVEHKQYLEELVVCYTKYQYWYDLGFVDSMNSMPETVDDVYNNNIYYT